MASYHPKSLNVVIMWKLSSTGLAVLMQTSDKDLVSRRLWFSRSNNNNFIDKAMAFQKQPPLSYKAQHVDSEHIVTD